MSMGHRTVHYYVELYTKRKPWRRRRFNDLADRAYIAMVKEFPGLKPFGSYAYLFDQYSYTRGPKWQRKNWAWVYHHRKMARRAR